MVIETIGVPDNVSCFVFSDILGDEFIRILVEESPSEYVQREGTHPPKAATLLCPLQHCPLERDTDSASVPISR